MLGYTYKDTFIRSIPELVQNVVWIRTIFNGQVSWHLMNKSIHHLFNYFSSSSAFSHRLSCMTQINDLCAIEQCYVYFMLWLSKTYEMGIRTESKVFLVLFTHRSRKSYCNLFSKFTLKINFANCFWWCQAFYGVLKCCFSSWDKEY